ncbi:MAG: hypothetical protein WCO78_02545 [Candidatus Roizmanbacteria bacterium]
MSAKIKPTAAQIASQEASLRIDEEQKVPVQPQAVEQSAKKTDAKKAKKAAVPFKRGAKYAESAKKLKEFHKIPMSPKDAIRTLRSVGYAKFDESVELHVNVAEVGYKGEVVLPFSNGKSIRVAIVDDAVLSALDKGIIDFDVLLTAPAMMPKLAKYAKLLGPRGLMPNPKSGTISPNPADLLPKFSGNTLRYKTEAKSPIIHILVGKKSFTDEQLLKNIEAIQASFNPAMIKSIYICSSMSPSLQIVV